jgi:tetratricopeptide (TPR) repeat protein
MRGSWEIAAMGGTVRLRLRQAIVFLGLGLATVMAGVSGGEEPSDKDWVGKRVVQRYNNFPVRVDGQAVSGSGDRFVIYRVERVEGGRLWLQAEGEGIRGWAAIGQVIPVDQAMAFFEDRIRAHPDEAFPHFMRAGLWMDRDELDRAVEDCTEIIEFEPTARSYVDRGNLRLRMHQPDKAIADFDQAIRLDPQATPAFTGRGDARQMKQEYDQAIADHSEAIRLSPDDVVARYSRGQTWAEKGDYDKAIADFNEALKLDPESVAALNGRGLVWHKKTEYDKAIADFDAALKLDPKSAAVYYNRGLAWQFKNEFTKAVDDFDQAVRLDPRYAAASQFGHPFTAIAAGVGTAPVGPPLPPLPPLTPEAAAAVDPAVVKAGADDPFRNFSQNLQRDLEYAELCMQRAYAWGGAKEYDKAIADFNEAIRFNPHLAGAYIGRGHCHCEKKEFDKAIADYDQALKIDPQAAIALMGRARARESLGQTEQSFADLDQAIKLDAQSPIAYAGRAYGWLRKKDCDKAIADFDEAIRLDPQMPSAYIGRGHARFEKKDYDKAIADYDEAVRISPEIVETYIGRARIWSVKKDYDKAIADYDEAIRLEPNLAWAYNNRAWLWSTCPDAKARDGKKAIESATKACELADWKEPGMLDTLAAAYAETGDFDSAVKWQTKANAMFTEGKDKTDGEQRLKLYQEKTPYRETKP